MSSVLVGWSPRAAAARTGRLYIGGAPLGDVLPTDAARSGFERGVASSGQIRAGHGATVCRRPALHRAVLVRWQVLTGPPPITLFLKDGSESALNLGSWRRERDSNPRWAVNPHTLSRRAT
jgi:hypothetical protein